jgi:hypothetical protein
MTIFIAVADSTIGSHDGVQAADVPAQPPQLVVTQGSLHPPQRLR